MLAYVVSAYQHPAEDAAALELVDVHMGFQVVGVQWPREMYCPASKN
jgi:hypothetical protein